MDCVLSRLVGQINDMCVCAFTARSLRNNKNLLGSNPIYGCDIDLSCIPNIIQHFHITSCISFAIPIATFATHSLTQANRCPFRSSHFDSLLGSSSFVSSNSSLNISILWSFFIVISLWFHFIRLFAFFSHSLILFFAWKQRTNCFVNVNQMRWREKNRTHNNNTAHDDDEEEDEVEEKTNANWSLTVCMHVRKRKRAHKTNLRILLLLRDFPPFEYFVSSFVCGSLLVHITHSTHIFLLCMQ